MDSLRGNTTPFRNYSMTNDAAIGNSWAAASRQLGQRPILRNSESWTADNHNPQTVDFLTALSNPANNPYRTNENSATGPRHNHAASPLPANGNPANIPYYANENPSTSPHQNPSPYANGNLATRPYQNPATSPYQSNGNLATSVHHPIENPETIQNRAASSYYPSLYQPNGNPSLYQPTENSAVGSHYGLFDSPIELGFSQLSLGPSSAYFPTLPAAYDTVSATAQPHLMSVRDLQQMRLESAVMAIRSQNRNQMGPYALQNFDNSEYLTDQIGYQLQNNQIFDDSENLFRAGYIRNPGRNLRNLNRTTARYSSNGGTQFRHANEVAQRREHLDISSLRELREYRGRIFSLAKDQQGSKYLQDKFTEGKPDEIQMIFMELKDRISELTVHQFGNYLMQKFLDICNEDQMTQLVMLLTDDTYKFTTICTDTHGSRFIQKLIEYLKTPEQKSRVISVLRCITLALVKSANGHHIIQHCLNLKFFTTKEYEDILHIIADNCLDIATDVIGCTVLQQCLGEATGEPRDRLLVEISSNALILSEHIYGNYVVQFVLGMKIEDVTEEIMRQLSGNFVSLSMNKFGSHVVEKCLQGSKQRQIVMHEILDSSNFLRVLQDRYGNYVAQVALASSQGEEIQKTMINMILVNYHSLQSHPYGKRVLPHARGSRVNSR